MPESRRARTAQGPTVARVPAFPVDFPLFGRARALQVAAADILSGARTRTSCGAVAAPASPAGDRRAAPSTRPARRCVCGAQASDPDGARGPEHTRLGSLAGSIRGLFCAGDRAEFVGIRGRRGWPSQCPSTQDSF